MKKPSSWRGFAALGLALAVGLPLSLAGCGEQCDPGYELKNHLCYQAAAPSGAAGAAGAPSCDEPSISTFGGVCRSDTDCVCDSDFCAGIPGQEGLCTRTGCDTDPAVCPDGFSCMDLSGFGAGLPHICVN